MEILDKIKFNYSESLNPKSKPFTKEHMIFNCRISYNRKYYSFEYQCNPNYEMPKLERVIECLITDTECFDNSKNFYDFALGLGYDSESEEAKRVYKACRKTSKAIHRLFEDYEISMLDEDIFYRC